MKITKENLVLVKTDDGKYINIEDSDYKLTGNWLYSHPDKGEPYIQVQLSDGDNVIYMNEDKFRFPTVYRHTVNELKPTTVLNAMEIIGGIIAAAIVLGLVVVGAVTILDKYILI